MSIAEIQGLDEKGDVKVNTLFEFKLTGEVKINEFGLPDVQGEFVQTGTLSERLVQTFYKAGISKETLEEFLVITENQD